MYLSDRERIAILMMQGYGNNVRSYETALFNKTFPKRLPITNYCLAKCHSI